MNTKKIITRFLIFTLAGIGFFGPFAAVVAVENSKKAEKIVNEQQENEEARLQYLSDLAAQKAHLTQYMTDAKTEYEKLLQDQPALIAANQKQVDQKTTVPVVTKKAVTKPATTTSKPKSSSKTKTS